jgi:hypothetical protein
MKLLLERYPSYVSTPERTVGAEIKANTSQSRLYRNIYKLGHPKKGKRRPEMKAR